MNASVVSGRPRNRARSGNYRRLKSEAPRVAMLPSNFDWFLAQCAVGADGILSGLANLTPHLLVDLWRATKALDLGAMRDAADRLYPIVRTICGAPPRMDMHTRIKAGLEHLGVIDCATPRAPLLPISGDLAAHVARTVDEASLARFVPASLARTRVA